MVFQKYLPSLHQPASLVSIHSSEVCIGPIHYVCRIKLSDLKFEACAYLPCPFQPFLEGKCRGCKQRNRLTVRCRVYARHVPSPYVFFHAEKAWQEKSGGS